MTKTMSDKGVEAARKLVDSCHCSQAPEPNPCDGWLQHRKCDSLARAVIDFIMKRAQK